MVSPRPVPLEREDERATCPQADCGAEFWWGYHQAEDCGPFGWSIECPECGTEFDPETSQ